MRDVSHFVRSAVFTALFATAIAAGEPAYAFDEHIFDDKGAVKEKSNPWDVFQFGYTAYKNGHKDQAVEALPLCRRKRADRRNLEAGAHVRAGRWRRSQ